MNTIHIDFEYLEETDAKFKKKLGMEIKRARESKCLTQKEFNKVTGINIARIETGKQHISLKTVRTICYALDISMGGLLNCIKF